MDKLLIICGPTATGKTSLALHLSKLVKGEIISSDSRQVYKFMDIGTGKDLPVGIKYKVSSMKLGKTKKPYYIINGVKTWGYDLVDPKEEFSVVQYENITRKIISNVRKRGKLPILVGGTGLYIKAVVDGIETSSVPRNKELRTILKNNSVSKLFDILSVEDPVRAASLNSSDRKNPRRLTRAIEIAEWRLKFKSKKLEIRNDKLDKKGEDNTDTLFIGLKIDRKKLADRIEKRVRKRIEMGVEKEIKKLLLNGVKWSNQSFNTLGYKQWVGYFQGLEKKDMVVRRWITDEKNYAKRQMTWFKKDRRIKWFDIEDKYWKDEVEKMVLKWHNER